MFYEFISCSIWKYEHLKQKVRELIHHLAQLFVVVVAHSEWHFSVFEKSGELVFVRFQRDVLTLLFFL